MRWGWASLQEAYEGALWAGAVPTRRGKPAFWVQLATWVQCLLPTCCCWGGGPLLPWEPQAGKQLSWRRGLDWGSGASAHSRPSWGEQAPELQVCVLGCCCNGVPGALGVGTVGPRVSRHHCITRVNTGAKSAGLTGTCHLGG